MSQNHGVYGNSDDRFQSTDRAAASHAEIDQLVAPWMQDGVFRPQGCRVHMIGIGGCGMRGIARVLMRAGATVSGSDRAGSGALTLLSEHGADIRIGAKSTALPEACDLVVHSAAIPEDHSELMAARDRHIPVIKYAQLLGLVMSSKQGIAVAGTHGKSTTTAMISYILREAALDPSFVIGAGVAQLGGGSGVGDGEQFIVEACEFDRSFHNLRPQIGTILNIDEDHLDYYRDLDEIIESFGDFSAQLPPEGLLIVNGEDSSALKAAERTSAKVETFGQAVTCEWQASIVSIEAGCCRFRVLRQGVPLAVIDLAVPGEHNVYNALAATAVCTHCGVQPETIADALKKFQGAHRRLTLRGCINDVRVVDDYAHHPREIQATLKAVRDFYQPGKLYVVFQPHQHSRTRFLLDDFAASFHVADVVIVPDIYFVRDSESEKELICSGDLVEKIDGQGGNARYEPEFQTIVEQLCNEVQPGDLVITMGAGNVWQVADGVLEGLSRGKGCPEPFVAMGDAADH